MRLIAHRGASAVAPENTLVAFEEAIAAGADGIEFDARLTTDGVVVVMHDDDVSISTDGTGRISDMSAEAVSALNAAARWPDWPERLRVPTLAEVIDLAAGRVPLTIELKGAFRDGVYLSAVPVATAVAPMVATFDDAIVSSFEPQASAAMREMAPRVRTALTSFYGVDPTWALILAKEIGHGECHVPRGDVTEDFVQRSHDAGIDVLSWTVNDEAGLRAMESMGVDGIFTDDPRSLRAWS